MFLGFKKKELLGVAGILGIIIVATLINLRMSFMKSRDASRKSDLRAIYDALLKYQYDFGIFPLDEDTKIQGCKGEFDQAGVYHFRVCEWYKDSLVDVNDATYPPYLKTIPGDPIAGTGRSYIYFSNGKHFQIYAALENLQDSEIRPEIKARHLMCGNVICNFGRSDGKTPLDKTLEEYENELLLLEEQNK